MMEIVEFLEKSSLNELSIYPLDLQAEIEAIQEDGKEWLPAKGLEDLFCTACNIMLTEDSSKLHYRLDWHRYNAHRKILGQGPMQEEQFLNTIDELSSVSGSDSSCSDDSDTETKANNITAVMDKRIKRLVAKASADMEAKDSENAGRIGKNAIVKPKVYLNDNSGKVFGLYRCLLSAKKVPKDEENQYLTELRRIGKSNFSCAVIMLGGGHFAAAIFSKGVPTDHKTFHSYTVRAKQGGSQSSRDSKSGGGSHPKSAGASLRRYNEAAFAQHVTDLVAEWKDKLAACTLILYRAVSSNNAIVFGGKVPLMAKTDPRLRTIPIVTRRATFAEVKRVYKELTTVEVLDRRELEQEALVANQIAEKALEKRQDLSVESPMSAVEAIATAVQLTRISEKEDDILDLDYKVKTKKKPSKPKKKPESNIPIQITEVELFEGEFRCVDEMTSAIIAGSEESFNEHFVNLINTIVALNVDGETVNKGFVLSRRRGEDGFTLLHLAALHRRQAIVWTLIDSGSDPSVVDYKERPPYLLCGDKETRNIFRRFLGMYPERYDYKKSQIPSPITEDLEKMKAARLAEKKKMQKIAKKEKDRELKKIADERKIVDAEKQKVEEEKTRFMQLSDREKRALAAERRLLAGASSSGLPVTLVVNCFLCGTDITGKVPFEYNNNLFCSTVCLVAHRKKGSAMKL